MTLLHSGVDSSPSSEGKNSLDSDNLLERNQTAVSHTVSDNGMTQGKPFISPATLTALAKTSQRKMKALSQINYLDLALENTSTNLTSFSPS